MSKPDFNAFVESEHESADVEEVPYSPDEKVIGVTTA
jgi:hypothetical protein